MASIPTYARSVSSAVKRVRLELPAAPSLWCTPVGSGRSATASSRRQFNSGRRVFASAEQSGSPPRQLDTLSNLGSSPQTLDEPRLSRSVQAAYLRPLKRKAEYGLPACDLQLRSYSVRNLELMADFALRAAYYLGLPASGPVPLPKLVERWTVSRSTFVHKKSQENFERITLRRLIQIQDAQPEVVQTWLAFIRKHAYYGVGMKANVWEHEKLGVGKEMDVKLENLKRVTDPKWAHFGRRKNPQTAEQVMELMRLSELRRIEDGLVPESS